MTKKENEIVLMMPRIKEKQAEQEFFPSGSSSFADPFPISIDQMKELVKGFTDYSLDTIELHVTGVAESDGITKLFIGLSAEAGVKLVLNKNM